MFARGCVSELVYILNGQETVTQTLVKIILVRQTGQNRMTNCYVRVKHRLI